MSTPKKDSAAQPGLRSLEQQQLTPVLGGPRVNLPGALLSFGDGHAAIDDGKVDGSAIGIFMKVRIQVDLVNQRELSGRAVIQEGYSLLEMDAYELLSKVAEIHLERWWTRKTSWLRGSNKKFLSAAR